MKKVLAGALLLTAPWAMAEVVPQDPTTDAPTFSFTAPSPWKVSVGGGVVSRARYEGSATNRLRFAPLLEADNGHWFASVVRGIGYNFSDDADLKYGLRIKQSPSRKTSLDPRLTGMGSIRTAADLGIFASARFAPWFVAGSLDASSHGVLMNLGGGADLPLSETDRLRFTLSTNVGNANYMQTFFGVTAAQSASSGLVAYQAGAGIKDVELSANWGHSFSPAWFSNVGMGVKQLAGNAANSPLTVRRTLPSASFVVGYRF